MTVPPLDVASSGLTQLTVPIGQATQAGNAILVAALEIATESPMAGVGDSAGNPYTRIGLAPGSPLPTAARLAVYVALNAAALPVGARINWLWPVGSSTSQAPFIAAEIANLSIAPLLDLAVQATTGNESSPYDTITAVDSGSTGTTGFQDDFLLAVVGWYYHSAGSGGIGQSFAVAGGEGWSTFTSVHAGRTQSLPEPDYGLFLGWQLPGVPGTFRVSGTLGTAVREQIGFVLALKPKGAIPPLAPTQGAVTPLDATQTMHFPWTFNDPEASVLQSAYQLLIIRDIDSVTVLDTGKVTSAAQTYALTANTLTNGRNYHWQVRTWNDENVVGPYAANGAFKLTFPVTVTSPTANQVETTPTIPVSWTLPGVQVQQDYALTVFGSDDATIVYLSGTVTSGTPSATIPAGHLHTGQSYYVRVAVTDTNGLFGQSAADVHFSLLYTPLTAIAGLTATAEPAALPPDVLLAWTVPTLIAGDTFVHYSIQRRPTGTTPWVGIGTITVIGTHTFSDRSGGSGIGYDYSMTYTTTRSLDNLTSPISNIAGPVSVTLSGWWLTLSSDPTQFLRFSVKAATIVPVQELITVTTWGRSKPTVYVGQTDAAIITLSGAPELFPAYGNGPGYGGVNAWAAVRAFITAAAAGGYVIARSGLNQETYNTVIDASGTQRQDAIATAEPTLKLVEISVD